MNYLQAPTAKSNSKIKLQFLRVLLAINLIAILITFLLNFLGLPVLKYHYLVHIFISIIAILFFDFVQILPIILTLFFFEGQGRIIWEYASWSRIIFDSLVLISVLKIFISSKKIVDLKIIPTPLLLIISAHFFWYVVEFFNLYSVSYFAVLAASKVYIYPILLFFGITISDIKISDIKFQDTLNFFIVIFILEIALTFFQFSMKEKLLLQISPYYFKIMKEGVFSGILYRPFGTTQLPGAIAVFLFLNVGFLFLKKTGKFFFFLRTAILCAAGVAIILCQVRSAFIKFILIIFLINIGEFIFHRFKARGFAGLALLLSLAFFSFQYVSKDEITSTGDQGIDYVRDRISSLSEIDKIRSSRLNITEFTRIVTKKLTDNPLGIGPGLTGAVGSLSKDDLIGNKFVSSGMTWTSDNLIISLIIDFGIGAIFYLSMLFYIPIYFFRFLIIFYLEKSQEPFKILLVCFSTIAVIIVGNWGAIGITYNPESFAFWFFAALGFSTISKYKKVDIVAN